MEKWSKIERFENYSISSDGRVRNDKTGHILSPAVRSSTCGYLSVLLPKGDGKYIHKNVHSLVAEAFIEKRRDGLVVNHIDGNKLNNNVDNLEWVTRSGNDKHAFNLGLRHSTSEQIQKAIGTRMRKVKNLTLGTEYDSIVEAAKSIGGQHSGISKCLKGERQTYYGMKFAYADKE